MASERQDPRSVLMDARAASYPVRGECQRGVREDEIHTKFKGNRDVSAATYLLEKSAIVASEREVQRLVQRNVRMVS